MGISTTCRACGALTWSRIVCTSCGLCPYCGSLVDEVRGWSVCRGECGGIVPGPSTADGDPIKDRPDEAFREVER